ncbi:hypothetical protein A5621_09405 [Mycobacterium colombiense]|uniref:Uncharacterized protein n=1 Tax=Mycobacterium colombiense TaxID=339268 RepID=A0A853LYG0_9MYCO|nr:hypothetical protein [Mycobacterium colombiense]OBJ07510.1 hypothetical protein A5623_04525 [Mycobacterium colombiense]OBJ16047.1 hypothetical protein A9W93_23490 [Mycobacterium colombiense]OBJ41459.1 hypothetical protein A5621_09405 [Mycobacterium colombiense]OBJ60340.1 hypothetical protein A5628_09040 [Mycobacterium colombiense]OBJ73980.1 hypothetical protein A5627_20375 [Mycobacterium colombiense]
MYLSAERLAHANQAVKEAFGQCSVAWQAIPHWDTGDPGQLNVPNGLLGGSAGFLSLGPPPSPPPPPTVELTVAETIAPTPDALLTAVMAATKTLANVFDTNVLKKCFGAAKAPNIITFPSTGVQDLQDSLIAARVLVENAGYRAPSCLVTNTVGFQQLNQLVSGYYNIAQQILDAANINSLYRFEPLDGTNQAQVRMVLIGRRRRIAQGAAPEASPGEEPVDLAFSALPSLEVDGETSTGTIQFSPRVRYAARITDATGLVALKI